MPRRSANAGGVLATQKLGSITRRGTTKIGACPSPSNTRGSSRLPADWADARFVLKVDDASRAERAASMLTAFQPGRVGGQVHFSVLGAAAGWSRRVA